MHAAITKYLAVETNRFSTPTSISKKKTANFTSFQHRLHQKDNYSKWPWLQIMYYYNKLLIQTLTNSGGV